MLFYDGEADTLRPLDERAGSSFHEKDTDWFEESTLVFEGDYSCPEDKSKLVDVVLGLYGFILRVRGPTQKSGTQQTPKGISGDRASRLQKTKEERIRKASSRLHPLIVKNFPRCFPAQYFGDLPKLMAEMLVTDVELKATVSKRLSQQSLMRQGTCGSLTMNPPALNRIRRWSTSLAQAAAPILGGAAAASSGASTAGFRGASKVLPSGGSSEVLPHAPAPNEPSAAASRKASREVLPVPQAPILLDLVARQSLKEGVAAGVTVLSDLEQQEAVRRSVKVAAARARARAGVLTLADVSDPLHNYR